MIDPPCFIIVAELCLTGVDAVEVKDRALTERVDVRARSFSAHALLGTDFRRTPDWRRMEVACSEGACVAYHKHCNQSLTGFQCVYSYSQPGDEENRSITVSATTMDGIRDAEESIAILFRSGWRARKVYLKAMSVEAVGAEPPLCDRHAKQMECWPSSYRP